MMVPATIPKMDYDCEKNTNLKSPCSSQLTLLKPSRSQRSCVYGVLLMLAFISGVTLIVTYDFVLSMLHVQELYIKLHPQVKSQGSAIDQRVSSPLVVRCGCPPSPLKRSRSHHGKVMNARRYSDGRNYVMDPFGNSDLYTAILRRLRALGIQSRRCRTVPRPVALSTVTQVAESTTDKMTEPRNPPEFLLSKMSMNTAAKQLVPPNVSEVLAVSVEPLNTTTDPISSPASQLSQVPEDSTLQQKEANYLEEIQ